MSIEEARQWIERLREISHHAAENAENARERLNHALADGDEVLAACLQRNVAAAEGAAQDVRVACEEMEGHLPEASQ